MARFAATETYLALKGLIICFRLSAQELLPTGDCVVIAVCFKQGGGKCSGKEPFKCL
jgi:hypothetical protein